MIQLITEEISRHEVNEIETREWFETPVKENNLS